MNDMTVRSAVAEDWTVIAEMNCALARETEFRELDPDTVGRGVRGGLELPDDVIYLVAESNGRVIGQLMLTREWSDWRNGWICWLQSVYVMPPARRRGVFRSLLQEAIARCRARSNVVAMRLYVEHDNSAAQETYRRLGFGDGGYRVFEMPL